WPFMRPLVARLLGIDAASQILMSPDPERTIGAGLAMFPVLRQQLSGRRASILRDQPQVGQAFAAALEGRLTKFASDLAQGVSGLLMPRVERVFWNWYRRGGSLLAVEGQVEAICQQVEASGEVTNLVASHWE